MQETTNDFLKFRDVDNKKMEFHNYQKSNICKGCKY